MKRRFVKGMAAALACILILSSGPLSALAAGASSTETAKTGQDENYAGGGQKTSEITELSLETEPTEAGRKIGQSEKETTGAENVLPGESGKALEAGANAETKESQPADINGETEENQPADANGENEESQPADANGETEKNQPADADGETGESRELGDNAETKESQETEAGTELMAAEAKAANGEPVSLNIENGNIIIEPDGYTVGSGQKVPYTGAYVISGNKDTDTVLTLKNSTGQPHTYDITLDNFKTYAQGNAAVVIETNDSDVVNLTVQEDCMIYTKTGSAAIQGKGSAGNVTVNVEVKGSGCLDIGSILSDPAVYAGIGAFMLGERTVTEDGTPITDNTSVVLVRSHDFISNNNGTHTCTEPGCETTKDCDYGNFTDDGNGSHTATCTGCGYQQTSAHRFLDLNYLDENTHRSICADCGAQGEISSHHMLLDYGDKYGHDLYCEDCFYESRENHIWSEKAEAEIPPTQDSAGQYKVSCEICSYETSLPIVPEGKWYIVLLHKSGSPWGNVELEIVGNGGDIVQSLKKTVTAHEEGFLIDDSGVMAVRLSGESYDLENYGVEIYSSGKNQLVYYKTEMDDIADGTVLYSAGIGNYESLKETLKKAPVDYTLYTEESVGRLLEAINAVNWYQSDQASIDGYEAAILEAIKSLELYTEVPDAQVKEISISEDDVLVIRKDGYALNDENVEYQGSYRLTTGGNAVRGQIIIESGRHNITLSDVDLTGIADQSPFDICPGASVSMTLDNQNRLTGYDSSALHVPAGALLSLSGSGSLSAAGGNYCAGIGGSNGEAAGTIAIHGGQIKASSAYDGAGIGGGSKGGAGIIAIYGGQVEAKCLDSYGAGIGTGKDGYGGTISIYDGIVSAASPSITGAGIGGANKGNTDSIFISGGTITARGNDGAGIGGGKYSRSGNITITGGTLLVSSKTGAAIGGGAESCGGAVTLTGGIITVEGHGRNIIGNGREDWTKENSKNFAVIDGAFIFSDAPDAIFPKARNKNGEKLSALVLETDRDDGWGTVILSDNSRILAYVKDKKVSVYVPEALASGGGTVSGLEADYSRVNDAVARAKALNPGDYKDFSAVEAALAAVEPGKLFDEQSIVDGWAQAIEDAIAALEEIPESESKDESESESESSSESESDESTGGSGSGSESGESEGESSFESENQSGNESDASSESGSGSPDSSAGNESESAAQSEAQTESTGAFESIPDESQNLPGNAGGSDQNTANGVKTGDDSPLAVALFVFYMAGAALCLAAILLIKRKRERK